MPQGFAPTLKKKHRSTVFQTDTFTKKLKQCFAGISDPRVRRTRLHRLSDILVIAILCVIAGGNGWEDMELYGESKHAWLSTFLALPHGIPCADTFRRVFARIDSSQFEACFQRWIRFLAEELDIRMIAIDGKELRGSYDREAQVKALHLVSAWASEHRLVLAQTKVQDKSNEITAIPALLELLDLKGAIVTLDAMGTQKTIAAQIHHAQADYILSLKANHPTLFDQVDTWFKRASAPNALPAPLAHTTESAHHRLEIRKTWTIAVDQFPDLFQAHQWAGLQTIVIVERIRHLWNKSTHEVQFYLCSLPPDSPRIVSAIRNHWGIENSLHWTLDVTFAEDRCRVRSLNAPHNLALLRRLAINVLNRESSSKRSLKQKSKRAAMDDSYMLQVLASALPDSLASAPACL